MAGQLQATRLLLCLFKMAMPHLEGTHQGCAVNKFCSTAPRRVCYSDNRKPSLLKLFLASFTGMAKPHWSRLRWRVDSHDSPSLQCRNPPRVALNNRSERHNRHGPSLWIYMPLYNTLPPTIFLSSDPIFHTFGSFAATLHNIFQIPYLTHTSLHTL